MERIGGVSPISFGFGGLSILGNHANVDPDPDARPEILPQERLLHEVRSRGGRRRCKRSSSQSTPFPNFSLIVSEIQNPRAQPIHLPDLLQSVVAALQRGDDAVAHRESGSRRALAQARSPRRAALGQESREDPRGIHLAERHERLRAADSPPLQALDATLVDAAGLYGLLQSTHHTDGLLRHERPHVAGAAVRLGGARDADEARLRGARAGARQAGRKRGNGETCREGASEAEGGGRCGRWTVVEEGGSKRGNRET